MIKLARRIPGVVYVLNLVELFERWGWYALGTGVLTYYIQSYFGLTAAWAGFTFSVFYALLYLATLAGGRIADRVLGRANSVALGIVLLGAGYFTMRKNAFLGAALVVCGNGLFKPNMTTLVGEQVPPGGGRRLKDLAFSLFYMAINVGAIIGPGLSGPHEARGDYDSMFMVAYLPMAAALAVYLGVRGRLVSGGPVAYDEISDDVWVRRRRSLLLVDLSAVFFWTSFHMGPTMLAFFTKDLTDRRLMGHEFSPGAVGTLNSIFVVTLTPLCVWFFDRTRLGARFDILTKMLTGMVLTGSSFLTLAAACALHPAGGAGLGWIASVWLQLTLGELFLSPMGNSMMSQNSRRENAGQMMGLWQCSVAVGTLIGGVVMLTWKRIPYHYSALLGAAAPAVGFAVMHRARDYLRANLKGEVQNTAQDDVIPPGKLPVETFTA